MFKFVSLIFILFFLVIGVTLGVLNPTTVELNLFVFSLQLPLSVIMASLFIMGLIIGALVIFTQVIRLRWAVRQKTKENQKLSDQIIQLKKANVKTSETLKKDSSALLSLEKKS
jgi:putative membrane protein